MSMVWPGLVYKAWRAPAGPLTPVPKRANRGVPTGGHGVFQHDRSHGYADGLAHTRSARGQRRRDTRRMADGQTQVGRHTIPSTHRQHVHTPQGKSLWDRRGEARQQAQKDFRWRVWARPEVSSAVRGGPMRTQGYATQKLLRTQATPADKTLISSRIWARNHVTDGALWPPTRRLCHA